MTQTIDVSGLSREAIRTVESLVVILRESYRKPAAVPSIFDLFGKAEVLRTGEEIAELREERDSWGEPICVCRVG